jgi:hypothetical protein
MFQKTCPVTGRYCESTGCSTLGRDCILQPIQPIVVPESTTPSPGAEEHAIKFLEWMDINCKNNQLGSFEYNGRSYTPRELYPIFNPAFPSTKEGGEDENWENVTRIILEDYAAVKHNQREKPTSPKELKSKYHITKK